ncbi:MAG: phosphoribosylamine--glycine ligase [Methylococcales bacterium]|nr:phosphoribosylamine--glycine ligase [Methylococcales bacterium]
MQVLIVGGGGREHALAWKAVRSVGVEKVYVAPGNAGTSLEPGVENLAIAADAIDALADFAEQQRIDLTIVGPEAPLVKGIVDTFRARGLPCFGPSQKAAQLEGSKAFAKDFMHRHAIPTAFYQTFTEIDPALAYIREHGAPIVVKADGLAAGKGVVVAQTIAEAEAAVKAMLADNQFGEAGSRVVIEEFLTGEEASFMVMANGETAWMLASSQDHKARDDGDLGPNTGGMGAYSPAPVLSEDIEQRIMREVIAPVLRGLAEEGIEYSGFLYAGLMVQADGSIKVLEFNCRLGDPETQPILMRLDDDLVALCLELLSGEAQTDRRIAWHPSIAVGVVLAAGGYPGDYRKGDVIRGLPEQLPDDLKVFHAGTLTKQGDVVTSGGRVLTVCALADSFTEARRKAYALAEKIGWPGCFYRRDIAVKALNRTS